VTKDWEVFFAGYVSVTKWVSEARGSATPRPLSVTVSERAPPPRLGGGGGVDTVSEQREMYDCAGGIPVGVQAFPRRRVEPTAATDTPAICVLR
jgi:hypothetical protein